MSAASRMAQWMVCLGAALLALGCEDIRGHAGQYQGPISSDPALRQGFAADARLGIDVAAIDGVELDMMVLLPGRATPLRFEPIRRAHADALGHVALAGDPLRTVFGYLRPDGEAPFLAVVSVFAEEKLQARIIRGPEEVYGVFELERVAP